MKSLLKFSIYILLFCALFVNSLRAQQTHDGDKKSNKNLNPWHREYIVTRISQKPEIDGRLDDPAWRSVTFSGDFLQREPAEGAPATEQTEIAIIYDDDNLYIAIRCYDSSPKDIRATEMRRDSYSWDDDNIEIILDTFDDKRSSFYFSTNPLGMRTDGRVNDEGKNNNRDWDGVWACKTEINEKGWNVEVAIPWQTLRFKEGDGVEWNANFIRMIRRKNEYDYWRLVSRDLGRNGKFRMSEGGRIRGFNGLKMSGNYEFLPYFSGGMERDRTTSYSTDRLSDIGVDLKWNISSNITADFTYNTDFAQVEADQERVNLTRFSLFFPEKREFFLEGAESFKFGQGDGGYSFMPRAGNIQLFHSRRIGIDQGYQVPVSGGMRLQGKAGKYNIGLMSIQAERTNLPDDDATITPETNFSMLRLKRDVLSRSSIGLMLLNKQYNGGYNRSIGFDSYFPVNDNLSFFTVAAGTFSPEKAGEPSPNKNNFAGNAGFNYDSDRWAYSLSILDIEGRFNPEMGYLRREDIRRTNARFQFSPRPERWESIRQIEFQIDGEYQTDHSNSLINRKTGGEFRISFENGARFNINLDRNYEYLDYDWENHGQTIMTGGYSTTNFRMGYNLDRSKAISGMFNINGGGYYGGKKYGCRSNVDLKAFNSFRANLSYNYNWVDLPGGEFHTNSLSARLSYSFNPDLFVKAYIQLMDDKLVNDGQYVVSSNILLRYIYRPGSDFYLVYNEGRMTGAGNETIENRTVLTKFTYFFRR